MRLAAALACASLAIAPAAFATPSFTFLDELCDGPADDCIWEQATALSPDGTMITRQTTFPEGLEWFRSGGRWIDVGGVWTESGGVGSASSNHFDISRFVHVDFSDTNVLVWTQHWWEGYDETWIAPNATSPTVRLPGAGCDFYDSMIAYGISGDGSTVIGTLDCSFGGIVDGAFRWTEAAGTELLGPPGNGSEATGVSDDGQVITGSEDGGAFVWTAANGYAVWPATISYVFPSGDGATLVGSEATANGTEAFVWNDANGFTHLGDLPGGVFESHAQAVTGDGSMVIGTSRSALGNEPFAWTSELGMVGVGFEGNARSVTDTGLVFGSAALPNGDDLFLWNPRNGWARSVESLLRDADLDVPPSGLESTIGISDDARVVVGHALFSLPWVATLPSLAQLCDVETNQASYVDGEDVVVTSIRFTNNETTPREARLRLQLALPFGITVDVLDLGASGGFFVPASFDRQLGPVTMFTLQPGQPRGHFSWRCALEEPGTGVVLTEDVADFAFE